jgi:hypothetical protein
MLSLPQAVHGIVKGIFLAKNMKKRSRDKCDPSTRQCTIHWKPVMNKFLINYN